MAESSPKLLAFSEKKRERLGLLPDLLEALGSASTEH